MTSQYSRLRKSDLIAEANTKILDLEAGGATDMNEALLTAIELANNRTDNPAYEEVKEEIMIIFLSDGQPTSGEMDRTKIKTNLRDNNKNKIPIYTISFGNDADFLLLKDIAIENQGFVRRIFEDGYAYQQLEKFLNMIADPKLKNVSFQYEINGKMIGQANLTKTHKDRMIGKDHYLAVGSTIPTNEIETFVFHQISEDENGKKYNFENKNAENFSTKALAINVVLFAL